MNLPKLLTLLRVEQIARGKKSREKRPSSRDWAFWAMGVTVVVVCLGGEPKPKNAFRWDQCGTEPGCPWLLRGSSFSQLSGLPEDLPAARFTSRAIIKTEQILALLDVKTLQRRWRHFSGKLTIRKTEGWYNSLGFSGIKDTAEQPELLVFGEGMSGHVMSVLQSSQIVI